MPRRIRLSVRARTALLRAYRRGRVLPLGVLEEDGGHAEEAPRDDPASDQLMLHVLQSRARNVARHRETRHDENVCL
jgi:hypothetical protein